MFLLHWCLYYLPTEFYYQNKYIHISQKYCKNNEYYRESTLTARPQLHVCEWSQWCPCYKHHNHFLVLSNPICCSDFESKGCNCFLVGWCQWFLCGHLVCWTPVAISSFVPFGALRPRDTPLEAKSCRLMNFPTVTWMFFIHMFRLIREGCKKSRDGHAPVFGDALS